MSPYSLERAHARVVALAALRRLHHEHAVLIELCRTILSARPYDRVEIGRFRARVGLHRAEVAEFRARRRIDRHAG